MISSSSSNDSQCRRGVQVGSRRKFPDLSDWVDMPVTQQPRLCSNERLLSTTILVTLVLHYLEAKVSFDPSNSCSNFTVTAFKFRVQYQQLEIFDSEVILSIDVSLYLPTRTPDTVSP